MRVLLLALMLVILMCSCKKYLDKPTSKSQVIPSTLDDLEALLNYLYLSNSTVPDLLEVAADNYYVPLSTWQNAMASNLVLLQQEALNYIWDKDAFSDISWVPYRHEIYYSNTVLDVLPSIPKNGFNEDRWNRIKGTALFYRGYHFQKLAQLYCQPYSSNSPKASNDLGLPLRLNSIIDEPSVRSTVQQTYDQIIRDLEEAAELLPETTISTVQPNKTAAYGALARTFLCMRDYVNAEHYADLCLARKSSLLDYNSLPVVPIGTRPLPPFTANPEVIYHSYTSGSYLVWNGLAIVDTILYGSYDTNDLRKTIFFDSISDGYSWYGSYASVGNHIENFSGIATDEIYLIKAECAARSDNVSEAMSTLNQLMVKRWKSSEWTPFTATDAADALGKILNERRKELCFRGLRWEDLRRLNLEGANITLKRILGEVEYSLPPEDLRWVMLIPRDVINRSGMQQNPR